MAESIERGQPVKVDGSLTDLIGKNEELDLTEENS